MPLPPPSTPPPPTTMTTNATPSTQQPTTATFNTTPTVNTTPPPPPSTPPSPSTPPPPTTTTTNVTPSTQQPRRPTTTTFNTMPTVSATPPPPPPPPPPLPTLRPTAGTPPAATTTTTTTTSTNAMPPARQPQPLPPQQPTAPDHRPTIDDHCLIPLISPTMTAPPSSAPRHHHDCPHPSTTVPVVTTNKSPHPQQPCHDSHSISTNNGHLCPYHPPQQVPQCRAPLHDNFLPVTATSPHQRTTPGNDYRPTLDDHSPIVPTSLRPLSIYGLLHPMVTPPLPLPPIPSINPTDSPPTHFGTSNSWSNVACGR
ncbi:hypothetical protein BDZ94DRAFT_1315990 [Collybia nuda]|uniref:Uncharacterized protein n=1 Tax=Collybia nuda TaxID=64659 RepID=A0A9P5XSB0_9AGAR|nr:hypothetical protein BDZ94DRAFT_1315990 [Collybia nuda]